MKKKLFFLYNPKSGKGLIKTKLSELIDHFVKAGYEIIVYPTQAKGDAYERVIEYQAQADVNGLWKRNSAGVSASGKHQ